MDKSNTKVKNIKSKSLRHIKRAIKNPNSILAFYNLKKIHIKSSIEFDDQSLENLFEFINNFVKNDIFIETDFKTVMSTFLRKVVSKSPELHIKCISLVFSNENDEIEFYRNMFGYSKIYSIFKDQMKYLFTTSVDPRFLYCLMALLGNDKLVYKSLSPVVEKLKIFLDRRIVDKSIIECCIALKCAGRACPKQLGTGFISSILTFLIDLLIDPQNYVFISFNESKIITDSVEILIDILLSSEANDIKKLSMGFLRLIIESISNFKHSTVYEEAMVVIAATACLTSVFKLFLHTGNDNIDFISPDMLNFMIFERSSKNELSKNSNENQIKKEKYNTERDPNLQIFFDRPFKHHYNAEYQILRDDFIVSKYKFLDLYYEKSKIFERIVFYNDLCKIEKSYKLFSILNNIKSIIEWSDLISFACNAPNKDNYIPFIFDSYFIKNIEHQLYIDLFLTNMKNSETNDETKRCLVYYTAYAIKANMMDLMAKLYLINLDKDDNFSKKRREMIIKFIALLNIKEEKIDIKSNKIIDSKEVYVTIDEQEIGDNMVEKLKKIEIKEIHPKKDENENDNDIRSIIKSIVPIETPGIDEFVESLASNIEYIHFNIAPLLIILMNRKISKEILKKLLEAINLKMNEEKEYFKRQESIICAFSIFCAIYKEPFFTDKKITSEKDLYIAILNLKIAYFKEEEINSLKIDAFDLILIFDEKCFKICKDLYNFSDQTNGYLIELNKIISIIKK